MIYLNSTEQTSDLDVLVKAEWLSRREPNCDLHDQYIMGRKIFDISLLDKLATKFDMAIKNMGYYKPVDAPVPYLTKAVLTNDTTCLVLGSGEQNNVRVWERLEIHSTERDYAEKVLAFYNENTVQHKPDTRGDVYMLMATSGGGLTFRTLDKKMESPLEAENYTPEVMAGFKRIQNDITTLEKPKGRIGIFDGPPGTGKTHLMEALITQNAETVFVFTPPHSVIGLAEPSALSALINFSDSIDHKPIVLVIEDADEIIAPRDIGNISYISQVLNLGDGILGKLLDIRLVLSTNAKRQQFDEAIIRPGRLSSIVKVGKLPAAQANQIFKRLTGHEGTIEKEVTLAEVYSFANDSGWVKPVIKETATIGFSSPSTPKSNG